jgi:hypothetical protein
MPCFDVLLLSTVVAAAGCTTALANDTGFAASSHDLRREGGRLCIVGHTHGGEGGGGSKSVALVQAIRSYANSTASEYGSDWGNWGRSAIKRVTYTKAGDTWMATAEARPCR